MEPINKNNQIESPDLESPDLESPDLETPDLESPDLETPKLINHDFEVICPHCSCVLIIEQINCGIFRHGYLKSTFNQINPHLSKKECDELFEKKLIYGCGKPFKLNINNNKYYAEICDYI